MKHIGEARAQHLDAGFTPAAAAAGPDKWLEDKAGPARYYAKHERAKHVKADRLKSLRAARRGYVRAAAFLLAAIERIDWILDRLSPDQEPSQ